MGSEKRTTSTGSKRSCLTCRPGYDGWPTKSTLIRFGDLAPVLCKRDGLKRPKSFSFLGLTHYLHVRSNGRTVLRHKTQGARLRKKLTAMGQRLKAMRTLGAAEMQKYVRQSVQGHLHYYGVSGNSRCLQNYVFQVRRLLFKWLNRRSQRRSFNWARYDQWVSTWMPRPRIVHTL